MGLHRNAPKTARGASSQPGNVQPPQQNHNSNHALESRGRAPADMTGRRGEGQVVREGATPGERRRLPRFERLRRTRSSLHTLLGHGAALCMLALKGRQIDGAARRSPDARSWNSAKTTRISRLRRLQQQNLGPALPIATRHHCTLAHGSRTRAPPLPRQERHRVLHRVQQGQAPRQHAQCGAGSTRTRRANTNCVPSALLWEMERQGRGGQSGTRLNRAAEAVHSGTAHRKRTY